MNRGSGFTGVVVEKISPALSRPGPPGGSTEKRIPAGSRFQSLDYIPIEYISFFTSSLVLGYVIQ